MKKLFLIGMGVGLLLAAVAGKLTGTIGNPLAMAAVAAVVGVWWVGEVMPLGITALVPLVAMPLLGILSTKEVAPVYMSSVLFLFIGGFFVAIALQRWNLHRRIALSIVLFFGHTPSRLYLGFMVATGFLSMWISNTAAAVLMVSIGVAVIKQYEETLGETESAREEVFLFATGLMLAIAYSATIGGMGTLVGTPPNLAFTRIYAMNFPAAQEVSFGQWFLFGLPTVVCLVLFAWQTLLYLFVRGRDLPLMEEEILKQSWNELGPIKVEEKRVLMIFTSLALGWIFRKDLVLGPVSFPGWSRLMPYPNLVDDGTVAVFMAMLLFLVPTSKENRDKGIKRLLDGLAINQIPWSTILLFGGGFALAKGIQASGLSQLVGEKLAGLADVPLVFVVGGLTFGMSFLTELTSNMASTEMMLPILSAISKSTGINPLTLMVPVTLAGSCAFMLPAATAPNAIVFGSERVRMKDMVKAGLILNFFSAFFVTLLGLTIIPWILAG